MVKSIRRARKHRSNRFLSRHAAVSLHICATIGACVGQPQDAIINQTAPLDHRQFFSPSHLPRIGVLLHVIVPYVLRSPGVKLAYSSLSSIQYWHSICGLTQGGHRPLLTANAGGMTYDYRYFLLPVAFFIVRPQAKEPDRRQTLKPFVGICGTPEIPLTLMDNRSDSIISAIDQRHPRLLKIVLSSSAGRHHQGRIFGKIVYNSGGKTYRMLLHDSYQILVSHLKKHWFNFRLITYSTGKLRLQV